MQHHQRELRSYPTYQREPIVHSTAELLRMQSQGKLLTPDEKQRVQNYAINKRKERLNKNR